MQEAIPCLCFSSPELGKESTFSCWSLNDHLLEEMGQGVLPTCCTCYLQEAEGPGESGSTTPQSWGREALQCQKFSGHSQSLQLQPSTVGDAATIQTLPSAHTQTHGKKARGTGLT